jgi:pimeloyl-ACP methyl ester carboxylesterase
MPIATIRGVSLNYEILGEKGPWIALSPGGRRPLESVKSLARKLADSGYRVLIHDRRNCGASDVAFDDSHSEYEIWADDLHELLFQQDALPAFIGGSSSGCRLSILFALRYPKAVRGLLLWRVTGGRFAAERLAENYYGQYIKLAQQGGMAAVCASEHFSERIAARKSNRDRLMKMDPRRFIDIMEHWREYFILGADLPVIGASAADLAAIKVPTLIIPGNDKTHGRATGEKAAELIPGSELYELMTEDLDIDLGPIEEWDAKEDEMISVFTGFLDRAAMRPRT